MLIAVDAGHYLGTPGRRCLKAYDPKEHKEWELNQRIATILCDNLREYGIDTIRCDDPTGETDITLEKRCEKANSAKADFFISIHHNAGINGGSGGGITAYSYYDSARGAEWRDDLYNALIHKTGLAGNRSEPRKEAGYYVIKHTNAPAVLLELGFMDSSTDIPVIITDEYAKLCAEAIADTIAEKFGIEKPETPSFADYANIPEWAKPTIDKLINKGHLKGVDGNKLDLSNDMTRILVILDRIGLFD